MMEGIDSKYHQIYSKGETVRFSRNLCWMKAAVILIVACCLVLASGIEISAFTSGPSGTSWAKSLAQHLALEDMDLELLEDMEVEHSNKKLAALDKALRDVQAKENLELDLTGKNMGDEGVLAVVKKLRKLRDVLTTLKLNENRISDRGIAELTDELTRCSNLTVLELMKNDIADDGAKALADMILKKSHDHLWIINVDFNKITTLGAMELTKAATEWEHGFLSIDMNEISKEGRGAIATIMKQREMHFVAKFRVQNHSDCQGEQLETMAELTGDGIF